MNSSQKSPAPSNYGCELLPLSSQSLRGTTPFAVMQESQTESARLLSCLAAHKEAACTTCDDSLPPTRRWHATFSIRHRRKQWLLFSVTAFWLQNWKLKMAAEVSSWLVATFPNCTPGLPTSVPFPTQVRVLRYQSTDRATVKASPTPSWKAGNITFVKRQGLWAERLHFKNKF